MKSINFFEFIYMLMILSLTYTACHSIPILSYALLFILFGLTYPIIGCPRFYNNSFFYWFLLYIFIVALNVVSGDKYFDSTMNLLYEAAYLIIPTSLFYYIVQNEKWRFAKKSVLLFIVILVLTVIATWIISKVYPSVVRRMNFYINEESEALYDSLYKFGLMEYALPHAVACLVAPIILGLKRKTNNRLTQLILIVSLVSIFLIVYLSGSFACLILTISVALVSWIISPETNNYKRSWLAVISVIVILLLTPGIRTSLFDTLLDNVSAESDFYEKIVELKEIDEGGSVSAIGGDVEARNNYYTQTIDAIGSSFLIGTDGTTLGRHSSFLDRMGTLGIIGIIPYVIFLVSFFSFTVKSIPKKYKAYYWVGVSSTIIMIFFKSANSWYTWFSLFFVLPISIRLVLKYTIDKNKKTGVFQYQ